MLDISLVVIGCIVVVISYFISEKIEQGKSAGGASGQVRELWSKKDEEQVRSQVEAVTSQKLEEAIDKVDAELSSISNEKIMAMDEFSSQLLEKIETNHKEVVFLYNMLNTKQDEIKKMVVETDEAKTSLEDLIRLNEENMKNSQVRPIPQQTMPEEKEKVYEQLEKQEKEALTAIMQEKEDSEEQLSIIDEKKESDSEKLNAEEEPNLDEKAEEKLDLKENVLKLYEEGKSVLEISKLLNAGQGEVRLIIDLYQGATI